MRWRRDKNVNFENVFFQDFYSHYFKQYADGGGCPHALNLLMLIGGQAYALTFISAIEKMSGITHVAIIRIAIFEITP